jgi:dTDP-4-dehydrorhamnose reductase
VCRAGAALAAGNPWQAPNDQRVSPTYVLDLVNVSLDLLIDGVSGLWHLANEGDVSWSELARNAAAALGHAEARVDKCVTAALRLPAVRPAYSVLGTERGQRLPPLDDALRRFVSERAASP